MTVLFDATCHRFILTHHTSNVPHTYHLPTNGIGEDNLIGNLLFAVLHRFDMYGYLLVIITDAATHSRDTLGLQTSEEQLLTDAVGLQALTVYVE